MSAAYLGFIPRFPGIDRFVRGWRRLIDRARDDYRPERHYMRGPGPKWHARQRTGNGVL
jgi:hypothetical protein